MSGKLEKKHFKSIELKLPKSSTIFANFLLKSKDPTWAHRKDCKFQTFAEKHLLVYWARISSDIWESQVKPEDRTQTNWADWSFWTDGNNFQPKKYARISKICRINSFRSIELKLSDNPAGIFDNLQLKPDRSQLQRNLQPEKCAPISKICKKCIPRFIELKLPQNLTKVFYNGWLQI